MKFVCGPVSVVPEDLNVVEHDLDDLLGLVELSFYLVAVGLGVLGMELVDPFGLVLDPRLDVVQPTVGGGALLADLLGQLLELLQPRDLLLNDLV